MCARLAMGAKVGGRDPVSRFPVNCLKPETTRCLGRSTHCKEPKGQNGRMAEQAHSVCSEVAFCQMESGTGPVRALYSSSSVFNPGRPKEAGMLPLSWLTDSVLNPKRPRGQGSNLRTF